MYEMISQTLSPDARVLVMLCSHLALPRHAEQSTIKPLSHAEWHSLFDRLKSAGHEYPSDILDLDEDYLSTKLNVRRENADRVFSLLQRGGQIAIEIENLTNKGIWILTEVDEEYPKRYGMKLDGNAPPVLFGAGDRSLLNCGGLAMVGARNVDERGAEFTERIAALCASSGLAVVSGAAKGVDTIAMYASLRRAGGIAIGVLADSLEKYVASRDVRNFILEGSLTVITPFHPNAGFSVANAMARNKLIYGLADYGLVVSSSKGSGGTWSGAQETMGKKIVPLFVRDGVSVPDGNVALLSKGAIPFPDNFIGDLRFFLESHGVLPPTKEQEEMCFREDITGAETKTEAQAQPDTAAISPEPVAGTDSPETVKKKEPTLSMEAESIYDRITPLLQGFISSPRTAKEIALQFDLIQGQVNTLLKRLVAENKVKKTKKPVKYIAFPRDLFPGN